MSEASITPIVMPKWGLAMQEGLLSVWHVAEGATIAKGQEIADIESSKIANVFESPVGGTLRRRVAAEGETLPVGALLGVVAPAEVGDAAIEQFIEAFKERFAASASAAETGPEPQTVEAGGRRVRYLVMSDAPGDPILLLHGFGGDLNTWMFNQPDLAEQRTTYALDLPGHGGSSKDVGDGGLGALEAAVVAFMDALGIGRAHLVGHSMGGALALLTALEHPGRVASLTLLAPGGLGPDIAMDYIDGFIETTRAKKLRSLLEMLVHDPALVSADMVEDVLKYKRIDGVDAALKALRSGLFPGGRQAIDLRPRLGEIGVPVQVIWGREDRILPARHAEGLPTSVKSIVLDATGHLPHMEKAREVTAAIQALTSAQR